MILTINNQHGVVFSPDGVTFPDGTPEEVVRDAWRFCYFVEHYGGKGKRTCREYVEKKWGFHKALQMEAGIITELGFEVSEKLIAKSDADPVPVTGRFIKLFSSLKDRWREAIDSGNVEYLRLAADALRPMVKELQEIEAFLHSQDGGAK